MFMGSKDKGGKELEEEDNGGIPEIEEHGIEMKLAKDKNPRNKLRIRLSIIHIKDVPMQILPVLSKTDPGSHSHL